MWEKYTGRYWARSGLFSFAQKFCDLFLAVGSLYFLIRILTPEQFGTWSLFITVSTVVELGKNGLIKNGLIKFVNSNSEDSYKHILGASLALNVLSTLVLSFGILAAAVPLARLWSSPQIALLFYLLPINLLCLIPYSHISFVQQAKMAFGSLFWSTFIRRSLFLFALLIIFFLDLSIPLHYFVLLQCLSLVVSSIVSFFLVRKILLLGFQDLRIWINKLFHYGKFVFGTNLSGYLASSVDQLMLGAMMNPIAVASYNISVRVVSLVEVPTNSVSAIVFPKSSQLSAAADKYKLRDIYEKSTGFILAVLLPAIGLVLCFPEFVIWLLAGEAYGEVASLLQVTILFALFIPFLRQSGTILDSIGKPRINFFFTLLSLIINPVMNIFFIRTWGLMGAAYASLVTYFVLFLLNQILLRQILGVRLLSSLKNTILIYQKTFVSIVSYGRKAVFRG